MVALILRFLSLLLAQLPGALTPNKSLLAVWRDAVARRDLREVSLQVFPNARLVAANPSWRVILDTQMDHRQDTGTRITVSSVSGAPFLLDLRPESTWTAFEKRRGVREVEVGDPSFDDVYYIRGDESAVLAALTLKARRAVRSFDASAHLEIAGPGISIEISAADESTVDPMLGRLLDLAAELDDSRSIPIRLAANAVSDRVVGVRLRNLVALAREFPRHEASIGAFRAGLNDLVPEVRLRAARALGAEAVPTLEQIALDTTVPDECSAEAIAELADRLSIERQLEILRAALRSRRTETAAACIERLACRAAPAATAALSKILAVERGRLGVAAAQALGGQPSERAESALREAIEREEEPDIRLSAAESLGRIGTTASVPSLQECARRHSGERLLQTAVRQSIAEIQSRRLGAEHGQLSLAAPTSGALSLTDEAGRLSLAEGTIPDAPSPRRPGPLASQ